MRFFTCLIESGMRFQPDGRSSVSERVRCRYDVFPRRRRLEYGWQDIGGVALLSGWDDLWGDPLVAKHGRTLAVGGTVL